MAIDKNDLLFDNITDIQLQLLRVEAQFRKDIIKELSKLEKELVSLISNEDNFTQRRLRILLSQSRKIIKDGYKVINDKMLNDLVELGEIESEHLIGKLSAVEITSATVSIKKLESLIKNSLINGAVTEDWWKRQSIKLRNDFEDTLKTGILLGETNQKLVQRVRGTRAFNYSNGIMNTSRRNADSLVRSSVQTASNQARYEVMKSAESVIKSYRHVATLDSRTSDQCIVRDGKRWESGSKNPIEHNLPFQIPPIHWNCRSTLIPEIKGVELPNDVTRASKDGPVSANVTFEDYLKSKNKDFVEEVLGKGKADLWLKGKINTRQLLDQSGNPLTLKELKSKYN